MNAQSAPPAQIPERDHARDLAGAPPVMAQYFAARARPPETLAADRLFADEIVSAALKTAGGALSPMASAMAEPGAAEARLKRLYGVETLDGFGDFAPAELSALGLLAAYIETTQAGKAPVLTAPR